ncbi:MAG: succinate dehydrogenase, cytochrome b556 subunit [Burkholderiales bacterium]|nr:succinate dehydrogenase, cytochrome b556 subunit [Ferrovum sp.]
MAKIIPKPRPKNLDLRTIRLPLPGIVSILHRVSGALLFLLGIPLLLAGLQSSLQSHEGFVAVGAFFSQPTVKLVLLVFIWAFVHHFCAGIRFLLLDIHKGVKIEPARTSSLWVMVISILLTLGVGVLLW